MSDPNGPQYVRQEAYVDPVVPVAQPAVFEERVVASPQIDRIAVTQDPVVVAPATQVRTVAAPVGAVQTAYTRRFSPDAVIAALVGLALLVIGLLAIVRGGFDGPMETPIVEVLGFTHTTTLGLIEAFVGACLLISGVTSSRSGALFFGSVLGIAAFVGAVQTDSFVKPLALESGHAWLLFFAALIVVVSALLMPRFVTRSTSVHPM
ncbi:MAG: hypothetical protein ABIR32_00855 [Ilumatobacteraceae bacterium]